MLSKIFILLIFLQTSILDLVSSELCSRKPDKTVCGFEVSEKPIANFIITHRTGETLSSCLRLFEKFHWAMGIYCPGIAFCGLGLDLTLDYRSLWKRHNFFPARHSCKLLADNRQNSCDELKDALHSAGLFSTWSCDGGGAELCLAQRGTECIQMRGSLKCEGCFTGYEPTNSPEETFCTDADECSQFPDICGPKGVCVNNQGSYSCRCYVGYISNPDPNSKQECIPEFPGWDIQMIFLPSSNTSFNSMTYKNSIGPEFNDRIFKKPTFEVEIERAGKVLFVLYDDKNKVQSELEFDGASNAYVWFSAIYLRRSSLWNEQALNDAVRFVYDENGFEITSLNPLCEEIGFLKITCDLEPECDHLKWWTDDKTLNGQRCGIAYSKLTGPVNYSEAFWASKIQILSSNSWELVFKVESFAGVDIVDYFLTGSLENPHNLGTIVPEKLFRDNDILQKLTDAVFVKVLVYNFEKTEVVSEIIFKGANDSEGWFAYKFVVYSSFWELEPTDENQRGSIFYIRRHNTPKYFYINQKFHGCDGDRGWMMITGGNTCQWEKWWTKSTLQEKFIARNEVPPTEYQPPYILYSGTPGSQKGSEWADGGKFEIYVMGA